MKKVTISTTSQLEKLRKKYLHKVGWGSFFVWFVLSLLIAAYVGLAIYGQGSYVLPFVKDPIKFGNIPNWMKWTSSLPYFKEVTQYSVFQIMVDGKLNVNNLLRCIVLVVGVLLPIILSIVTMLCLKNSKRKLYTTTYNEVVKNRLQAEHEIEFVPYTASKEDLTNPLLRSIQTEDCNKKDCYLISKKNVEILAQQITYKYKDQTRYGFLLKCNLTKVRNSAFIQLRNYGKLNVEVYEGNPITKLGFEQGQSFQDFICYSSLGQATYKVVDINICKAIDDIRNFTQAGIVFTLEKTELSCFLEGFELHITRKLEEKLSDSLIERQAIALNVLVDKLITLAKAVAHESSEDIFADRKSVV